ncbi:S-layer homology domain-containing protein [bacterium]|nr:S-layer homology domain-containing protein [bacterium]
MKKMTFVLVALLCVCSIPVFAQGPFTDVPTDHWAYDAVNQLQQDGIIIGYPDGTFAGKRTITRYEFAVAIARVVDYLSGAVTPSGAGVTQAELDSALEGYAKKSEIPTVPTLANLASKSDLDQVRKLVDEFRDELAALGVDVDALKRDVAALTCRVDILEAEVNRVKVTGDLNVAAFTDMNRSANNIQSAANAVDLDNRTIPQADNLGNSIGVVHDLDLNIVGRVSCSTTVNATIDYGNYLNYIRYVDDYVNGDRPTTKTDQQDGKDFVDAFFPYYAYINAALCKGTLSVGRFPIAFTPYTLKKIDVDAYTNILKTDDGYYPMDGISLATVFGGVDVTLFAAKNNENDYMKNGLTGQPSNAIGVFNVNGGNAVGGIDALITQTAGGRFTVGIPWGGKLGGTFYQAWANDATLTRDQARVFGGDLAIPYKAWSFAGSWTRSDTRAARNSGAANTDDENVAWDAKVGTMVGKLDINAGYKDIGRNFAAAGAWDKIGNWTNPVDINGPYVGLTYPIMSNLKAVLNGEFLTVKDTVTTTATAGFDPVTLNKDDQIIKAEGGVQWGISKANSLALGYQWVKFDPDDANYDYAIQSYLTIGWAHQVNPDAALKIGYQFMNWNGGNNAIVYGKDYQAGLGVVQFGVSF